MMPKMRSILGILNSKNLAASKGPCLKRGALFRSALFSQKPTILESRAISSRKCHQKTQRPLVFSDAAVFCLGFGVSLCSLAVLLLCRPKQINLEKTGSMVQDPGPAYVFDEIALEGCIKLQDSCAAREFLAKVQKQAWFTLNQQQCSRFFKGLGLYSYDAQCHCYQSGLMPLKKAQHLCSEVISLKPCVGTYYCWVFQEAGKVNEGVGFFVKKQDLLTYLGAFEESSEMHQVVLFWVEHFETENNHSFRQS